MNKKYGVKKYLKKRISELESLIEDCKNDKASQSIVIARMELIRVLDIVEFLETNDEKS